MNTMARIYQLNVQNINQLVTNNTIKEKIFSIRNVTIRLLKIAYDGTLKVLHCFILRCSL